MAYLITSGSHFRPFTYDELVKPLAQMTEAQNTTQDEIDTLSMQAGAIGSMLGEEDVRARQLYDGFMGDVDSFVDDLTENGYNANSRRMLSSLRNMYGKNITKINAAITQKAEAIKQYDTDVKNDKTLITERDPRAISVDAWLDDPYAGNYRSYSGNTLMVHASAIGENLKRDLLTKPEKWNSILGGQYFERDTFTGFHASEVKDAISHEADGTVSNNPRVALLQNVIGSVYNSSGMNNWATPEQKRQALSYIGDGLYSAVGAYKTDIQQNQNFTPDYKKMELALRQQANAIKAAAAGQQQTVAKPEVATIRGNEMSGIPDDGKKEAYDTLKIINDLKKSGGFYGPDNRTPTDAADKALSILYKNKYYKELSKDTPRYLSTTNLDEVLAKLGKELNDQTVNEHSYIFNFDEAASSNIATNIFKLNVGELGTKGSDSKSSSFAKYSNKEGVPAKELQSLLNDKNVKVGYDAKRNKLTLERVGSNDKDKPNYDDRIVYIDPSTALTGTSASVNLAALLYTLDQLPSDLDHAGKEKRRAILEAAARNSEVLNLYDLTNIIHQKYDSMMVRGSEDDKIVFNSLVDALGLGLYDGANVQWKPNPYSDTWGIKAGSATYDPYSMYDFFNED